MALTRADCAEHLRQVDGRQVVLLERHLAAVTRTQILAMVITPVAAVALSP